MKEKLVDTVKGRIGIVGNKALFIDYGCTHVWTPESIIHSKYERYNTSEYQVFKIEKWFLDKHQIDGWDVI